MDIEELSRRSGVEKQSIYRYVKAGLLHKPIKGGTKQAVFDEDHLTILRRIKQFCDEQVLPFAKVPGPTIHDRGSACESDSGNRMQSKKEQIMDKAIMLFSKNGFAETKVSDITDALGVAKGTFYLYFKSKKDLFLECIGRLTMIIIPGELWESVREERDFVQRQRMKLRQFLLSFPTFSGIVNLLRLSFQSEDPELAQKARETYKILAGPLMKDLRRAVAEKVTREVNVEVVSLLLMGMAESIGYLTMMDARHSLEEGAEILLDLMCRGLLISKEKEPEEADALWEVEDSKGFVVLLKDIRIEGDTCLAGMLGEGKVRVPMQNLARVEIVKKDEGICYALITLKSDEQITLSVDGQVPVLGESAFGEYSTLLAKISCVSVRSTSPNKIRLS